MTALLHDPMTACSLVTIVLTARRAARCVLVVALCAATAAPLTAQQAQPSQREATRAALEAMAAAAERGPTKADRDRAAAIRERLRRGDFTTGDQIILEVEGGEKPFSDTVRVHAGQLIRAEGFPDISLRGVLRSELNAHLTREFARYLRLPQVTARSLVRLTVAGSVARPGFYVVPYDATVSDVIMEAGGPSPNAKIEKTEVRRGESVLYSAPRLAAALREGQTLDDLGLTNGDAITVGAGRRLNWTQAFQVVGLVVSLVTIAASLSR